MTILPASECLRYYNLSEEIKLSLEGARMKLVYYRERKENGMVTASPFHHLLLFRYRKVKKGEG